MRSSVLHAARLQSPFGAKVKSGSCWTFGVEKHRRVADCIVMQVTERWKSHLSSWEPKKIFVQTGIRRYSDLGSNGDMLASQRIPAGAFGSMEPRVYLYHFSLTSVSESDVKAKRGGRKPPQGVKRGAAGIHTSRCQG